MTYPKMLGVGCCTVLLLPLLLLAGVIAFSALALNPRIGVATDYKSSPLLATPPPLLTEPITLKIITFNIADAYL
ncbi:MAG TPA: hypothetical protein ENN29_00480, partial [Candidatus Hydrogenedentes bacterium]|nr:hypothetical protein [Candidatus Hydrogenedentota bacterium]